MRLIIDTDPGMGSPGADPEDGLAVLLALGSPGVTVDGITVVAGNVPTSHSWANVHHLLDLAGRADVPVRAGAAHPLSDHRIPQTAGLRMREGLGRDVPAIELPGDDGAAAEFICETVLASPGEVTLVAIGPLTNVARAIELDPTVAGEAAGLVIMGGTVEVAGNITPAAEFNIWMDPEAADVVFASGAEITMVGLDVCHRTHFDLDQVAALRGRGPLADFVAEAAASWIDARGRLSGDDDLHLYDSLAMAAAIQPEILETRRALVQIETSDGPAQGMTVAWTNDVLRSVLTGREPNASVAVGLDLARFEALFRDRVLTPLESVKD